VYEQTKTYIVELSDEALLEYVLTGTRMYEPDAVAFAKEELTRRNISDEQKATMRSSMLAKLVRYDIQKPPDPIQDAASDAIICQRCGLETPTKYVEYHENIGVLVARMSTTYRGHFCNKCNRKLFWKSTLTTFFLGWWGVMAFFVTIVYLIDNLGTRFQSRSLAPVPLDATRPTYDDSVVLRLAPYLDHVTERLTAADDLADIAREVAPLAGTTPGQAWCFVKDVRQKLAANQMANALEEV